MTINPCHLARLETLVIASQRAAEAARDVHEAGPTDKTMNAYEWARMLSRELAHRVKVMRLEADAGIDESVVVSAPGQRMETRVVGPAVVRPAA